MNWRIISLILLSSLWLAPVADKAEARCELAPNGGGRSSSCGGGSTQRSSSGANAAALLGLGIAILDALPEPEERPIERVRPRDSDNIDRMSRAFGRAGAIASAANDPSPRPAATRPVSNKPATSGNRAPYANDACVKFNQRSRGKIDWDYVDLTNTCNIPIQVLTCYYLNGEESLCNQRSRWGVSDTIQPRAKSVGVSSTRTFPFKVRYFVCDMSGVTKHSKLCLLPKLPKA
ncbi:hypothetical protein [Agrobacterium tumefaciens]|uniref:hypothetical protein n=1 Tax=Agrobacterium tumefaciens TaxID=358 RepID=UPI00287BEB54|nr:hypothetical protein [Agrobacterium tumefaciens]MDS7594871.1 hypothetical protein [Agrobacterium tumefaciens]